MAGKGERRGRKLTYVREDLLQSLFDIARRENKTLYALVNDIFESTAELYAADKTLSEVLSYYDFFRIQGETGTVSVPSEVLDEMIRLLYREKTKGALEARWYAAGQWYGSYLRAKFERPVEKLAGLLPMLLSDFKEAALEGGGASVQVRCISPSVPAERIGLQSKFLEGVMHTLGYRTAEAQTTKGIISLRFEKGVED